MTHIISHQSITQKVAILVLVLACIIRVFGAVRCLSSNNPASKNLQCVAHLTTSYTLHALTQLQQMH